MIRNLHTLENSWWDGPKRFQYVNRNVITQVQTEDMFKFIKTFAPSGVGVNVGGRIENDGTRSGWNLDSPPYILTVNIDKRVKCDIRARAERLPFLDESLAFIVSSHTVEHIRGDLKETFKEWFRVLKPNGLIGIVMPDKRHFLHDPQQTEDGIVAYREMESKELPKLFSDLSMETLLFDTRQNNFDFDLVLRK